MTVQQVSKLTGVSVRTLHYYDQIGLLQPAQILENGYREYQEEQLERLQQILLFRELEFPLKEIKEILGRKDFDRSKALEHQIQLLTLKKEHLENLIDFARGIKLIGVKTMNFKAFDKSKIDEYAKQAKEQWGKTEAFKEFEEKDKNRSEEDMKLITENFMNLFVEFGKLQELGIEQEDVKNQVQKLQNYITEHFYTCTPEILRGLGQMYAGGGDFTENINKVGGSGCGEFTARAIEFWV